MQEFNKYFIRSLTRAEFTRIMMHDARNETLWVRDTTLEACNTHPNLTKSEIETNLALEEEIEL